MSALAEHFAETEVGQAEVSLKAVLAKESKAKILSNYPKFNQRLEVKQMEDVHKRLERGEMSIKRENS